MNGLKTFTQKLEEKKVTFLTKTKTKKVSQEKESEEALEEIIYLIAT